VPAKIAERKFDMSMIPAVSVIMPVYNGERFIKKAIDSVLIQQVDFELIIIDDCSTDGTADVIEATVGNRSDIIVLKNEYNMGAAKTRNRGISAARGEYIAFLDADDWWEKDKLARQLKLLKKTGLVLCSTARELMNSDGETTGTIVHVKRRLTYHDLLYHNSSNCSSVVVKREVILEFPMLYDDSHEDYITWLKILRKYGASCAIDEPLLKYRLSAESKSGNKWKSARMTFKVYRYMGFGVVKSSLCFVSYAVHGAVKYKIWRKSALPEKNRREK